MSKQVMIVDDDEMNRMILREILEEDYELVEAHNGREAIEVFKQHTPAVVLMDIMMPEVDGYTACRAIKDSPYAETTHVILVSAKASTEERVRGYQHGADDYIIKPFDDEELLAKVRVYSKLREATYELAKARTELAGDNQSLEALVEEQTAELVQSRDMVVFALASLADSRDPETGDHLQRIREYCKLLAVELAAQGPSADIIDDQFIDQIYLASPLHDIGKVGIPDAILLKPAQLSAGEFEKMQEHTVVGAEALQDVQRHGSKCGFLDMAIQIARSHHERWNGSGYPDGLVGEQIPLAARIVGLADVFDALTSHRVYKQAYSTDTAHAMIVGEAGSHFDPEVVAAYERCAQRFATMRDRINAAADTGPRVRVAA
jgi:putative two-component system response regulator